MCLLDAKEEEAKLESLIFLIPAIFSLQKVSESAGDSGVCPPWEPPYISVALKRLVCRVDTIVLADDILKYFTYFVPQNRLWHFMQIVSSGDNLHEMPEPIFWEK